jgi:hypothetical protein
MAEPQRYEPVLSSKATSYLLGLSKARQRRLIVLLFRLAEHPGQPGDYGVPDEAGRDIQFLLVGDLLIGYWPDHAVAELRIVNIEEV